MRRASATTWSSSGPKARWPPAWPMRWSPASVPVFGPGRAAARLETSQGLRQGDDGAGRCRRPRPAPLPRCGGGPGPCASPGPAAGGQGRWAGRRQGRGRPRLARGGGGRHPRPVRRPGGRGRAWCWRSGWRAAKCQPSPWSAARPSSRWQRPATTSGWATATPARTPAAWAPTARSRGSGRRARIGGGRGLRAGRLATGARRHPVPRRALRRADADRRWPDGAGVQRALRRPGGAGRPAAARRRAGATPCWAWPAAIAT